MAGYRSITHGLRNYIERWYLTFKNRTKCFYNNFPIKDPNRALERISKFMHLYAYWYNRMRPHERFHNATPFSLS
jgi:transposase-like protein